MLRRSIGRLKLLLWDLILLYRRGIPVGHCLDGRLLIMTTALLSLLGIIERWLHCTLLLVVARMLVIFYWKVNWICKVSSLLRYTRNLELLLQLLSVSDEHAWVNSYPFRLADVCYILIVAGAHSREVLTCNQLLHFHHHIIICIVIRLIMRQWVVGHISLKKPLVANLLALVDIIY